VSRAALAKRQVAFVQALTTGAAFDGVPRDRMNALSAALLSRRFREARRLAPALDAWLGPRFEVLFRKWMGYGPQTGGALTELLGFAAGLSGMPEEVNAELELLRLEARRRAERTWIRRPFSALLASLRLMKKRLADLKT
jgi:hypothetical protein